MTAHHEMFFGPFEDVVVPKPHSIQANVRKEQDFVQIGAQPRRIIDIAICKSGLSVKLYLTGLDIFTGVKKVCLHHGDGVLVPLITVSFDEVDLLDISDDGHYSVMGEDNSVADNVKIYKKDLAKKIRDSWADGERTIMVKVAETMGLKSIIAAWEVREVKFMTNSSDEDGALGLKAVDSESPMEILFPKGDMRKQIEEYLIRERGKPEQLRIRSPVRKERTSHSWEIVFLEALQPLSTDFARLRV
jgi:hypothetical protein